MITNDIDRSRIAKSLSTFVYIITRFNHKTTTGRSQKAGSWNSKFHLDGFFYLKLYLLYYYDIW